MIKKIIIFLMVSGLLVGGIVGPDVVKKVQFRIAERLRRIAIFCGVAGAVFGGLVVQLIHWGMGV